MPSDPARLLGAGEVAELLMVERETVHQWRRRGRLPEPDIIISGRPAWRRDRIEAWARETDRWPILHDLLPDPDDDRGQDDGG